MKKYYKVMIDYKNFISIDESELDKALQAHAQDGKAFFKNGSVSHIQAVLPDFHKIMGWNEGYTLVPEDHAEIARSQDCQEARNLLYTATERLAGRIPEETVKLPQRVISDAVKKLAEDKRP